MHLILIIVFYFFANYRDILWLNELLFPVHIIIILNYNILSTSNTEK